MSWVFPAPSPRHPGSLWSWAWALVWAAPCRGCSGGSPLLAAGQALCWVSVWGLCHHTPHGCEGWDGVTESLFSEERVSWGGSAVLPRAILGPHPSVARGGRACGLAAEDSEQRRPVSPCVPAQPSLTGTSGAPFPGEKRCLRKAAQALHQERVVSSDPPAPDGALHSEPPVQRATAQLDSPEPYSAESSRPGFLAGRNCGQQSEGTACLC